VGKHLDLAVVLGLEEVDDVVVLVRVVAGQRIVQLLPDDLDGHHPDVNLVPWQRLQDLESSAF